MPKDCKLFPVLIAMEPREPSAMPIVTSDVMALPKLR
jgi:hypothetical protein